MSETKTAKFKKTADGVWTLVGKDLVAGEEVQVVRRDGTSQTKTVGTIVSSRGHSITAYVGTSAAEIAEKAEAGKKAKAERVAANARIAAETAQWRATENDAHVAEVTEAVASHVAYVKVNGAWMLCGPGLVAGEQVTVIRRDGTTKTETVGEVDGEHLGQPLATVASDRLAGGSERCDGEPCRCTGGEIWEGSCLAGGASYGRSTELEFWGAQYA